MAVVTPTTTTTITTGDAAHPLPRTGSERTAPIGTARRSLISPESAVIGALTTGGAGGRGAGATTISFAVPSCKGQHAMGTIGDGWL